MANEEHVERLLAGVDEWNAWREENPLVFPDLSRADLSNARLSRANLRLADLTQADLSGADLSQARLVLYWFSGNWTVSRWQLRS